MTTATGEDAAGRPSSSLHVRPGDVAEFGTTLLTAAGFAPDESRVVAGLLVETSLRGTDSHGVGRFPVYARRKRAGGIASPAPLQWVRDQDAVAVLDGGGGAGHVVGAAAVDDLVERARRHGVAAVGVRNSNHLGALAPYARRIADAGHVSIVMTNASPRLAPTGGVEALLGNNPWAIGVPRRGGALVMDIAHSVVAVGKIRLAKAAGQALPHGWARDRRGQPTTDPDEALAGLVEPIGGHKGYALAFMIDVLTGVLTGARSGQDVGGLMELGRVSGAGHQFIALHIDHFTDRAGFDGRLEQLAALIQTSRRADGTDVIHLPGDIEIRTCQNRSSAGIPLTAAVLQDFRVAAEEMDVIRPSWLSEGEGGPGAAH